MYHPCFFDVFCGSFETAGYHSPDHRDHGSSRPNADTFTKEDLISRLYLFEGQVVKLLGFLATKWALQGVTKKALESKTMNLWQSQISTMMGKETFSVSEPCSKSKLSSFSGTSIFLRGVAGHSRFLMRTVRICWKIFENDIGVASQSFKANTTKGSVDLLVEMWISWNFHKSWHWPFQNPTKTLQVSSSHER